MKTLKTLLVAALLSVGCAAQAQDADYTFKKHAYLQLQGGAQYTLGEAKFGDLISPNVQAALGYQFRARVATMATRFLMVQTQETSSTSTSMLLQPSTSCSTSLTCSVATTQFAP